MNALIASNDKEVALILRTALLVNEFRCKEANLVSLQRAGEACAAATSSLDLVFVVVDGGNLEPSLQLMRRLRVSTVAKLVAVGPHLAPRQVLQTVHAGAEDYLELTSKLADDVRELTHRLHCSAHALSAPGLVVSVLASDGGVGCSVISANLAAAFAAEHQRSAVFDLNFRHGDQSVLFNVSPQHTLADLCHDIKNLDQSMLEQSLALHPSGVRLAASPASGGNYDAAVDVPAVGQIVRLARLTYPFVVLDLDCSSPASLQLALASDVLLVAFRLDFVSLLHAHRLLHVLEHARIPPAQTQLLANRYGQEGSLSRKNAEVALGRRIDHWLPDDPGSVLPSVNLGNPAVLESPKSPFAKSVKKVATRLGTPASTGRPIAAAAH